MARACNGENIFGDIIRDKTVYTSDYMDMQKVKDFEIRMEKAVRTLLEKSFAQEFEKEIAEGEIEIYF